tara:strand:- start:747 stop:998 length:252 start_codon:yes stop_codon:yes gene_type:complete
MKEKNLPDDNTSQSLEELRLEVSKIIEKLERENDLKNSVENYQKLIRLNNIIEKKFQKKSKLINENTKEKIKNLVNKKNAKKT